MKHFHGYIPLIAAILSVFPCCSDFGESPETSISFQHDRWKSFDLHSYSVIQLRGCVEANHRRHLEAHHLAHIKLVS